MVNVAHTIEGSKAAAVSVSPQLDFADLSLKNLMAKPNMLAGDDSQGNAAAPDQPFREKQSFGQYLFGSPYADPTDENAAPQQNWTTHTKSRIYIRLFSRGLMGATFYSIANRWAPGQLKGYRLDAAVDTSRPLQYIARGFDIAYGKPIKAYVKQYYKLAGETAEEATLRAERATTFRRRKNFGSEEDPIMGRSLGAEIVGMSTDFAAGSVGDAWGRQIAILYDPNIKKSWEDEKDGHIHWKQFAKSNAQSAWQIFSKNQGEDWAAALPYVYQMRFQRRGIDKLYRGFAMSSDHQFNGGSWRVNPEGEIVGSYAKAGALDLQARFTGYNWYTLMYRDLYDNVAERLEQHKQDGTFRLPSDHGFENPIESCAQFFRYVTKSAVKATIYMTPAVPFFWATRTPQSKTHGMSIVVDSQTGDVSRKLIERPANPFAKEHTRGVFDRALSPLGKACAKTAEAVNKTAHALGAPASKTTSLYTKPTFAETWVNSSASYTPYMIAKAETALRWNRPPDADGLNEMDRAIYRALDGVARLNLGEVKGGLSDIREEIIRPPSNRQINAKSERIKGLRELVKQAPSTTVSDVEEDAPKKSAEKQDKTAATETKDTSWEGRHAAHFAKDAAIPDGATIH